MIRKVSALKSIMVVMAVIAVSVGLLELNSLVAQETPTASRSFSEDPVDAGDEVTVEITAEGHDSFGQVAEMLPPGFTYLDSSLPVDQVTKSGQTVSGETVTLSLLGAPGPTTFTYTVRASSVEGDHPFRGVFSGVDTAFEAFSGVQVVGDPSIEVAATATPPATGDGDTGTIPPDAGGPSAARSFSADPVDAGDEVTVEITTEGHGSFGQVAEMLPPGFTYLDSSLPGDQVTRSGQTVSGETVTLSLLGAPGPTTFTYTVRASSVEGDHPFSGDFSGVDAGFDAFSGVQVGGDPSIEVGPPAGPNAKRSFSATSVAPRGRVTVTIIAEGHGSFGEVAETLPAGFTYLESSLPGDQVTRSGQTVSGETVTLSLIGATSPTTFTYTVRASSGAGDDPFKGLFSGVDTAFEAFSGVKVGGTPSIPVRAATPPTKTRTPTTSTTGSSGSGSSGSGGGSAPAAATPTPTPTPAATATPPPTVVPPTPPATLVPTAVPDTPMPTAPVAIPVGPPGEEGEQGEPGTIGDLGPKGKPGTIGDPGPKGATGSAGPKGATGSAGPKGATGSGGETGARGDAGPVGEAGATGESGSSGILGIVALILGIVAIVGVGGAFLLRRN